MAARAGATRRKTSRKRSRSSSGVPSKGEILEFLAANPDVRGRREIGRAFGIAGKNRFTFKALLRQMTDEGLIGRHGEDAPPGGPSGSPSGGGRPYLPPVGLADIVSVDDDGELWAVPVAGRAAGDEIDQNAPRLRVRGLKRGPAPERLGVGARILARFVEVDQADGGEDGAGAAMEARVIKHLDRAPQKRLGVVAGDPGGPWRILPVSKKGRDELTLERADAGGARPGDLVTVTLDRKGRGRDPRAKVIKAHGPAAEPGNACLIAIHEEGILVDFPAAVLRQAEAARLPGRQGRTDLRNLPLITIDPADARDHDDAVHAQTDPDAANPGGWIVTVAIADVAAFVTPGSELDREARKRGNSVYFPTRVVPMLPEALSADLCSLRQGQDRPVMAVRMVFDARGRKKRHEFFRANMRSVASLSYEMVQAAWDGAPDKKTAPLLENILKPLFGAYDALANARDAREPLDLNIPERRIRVDERGVPVGVETPPRLEAHRLIEEFMVLANVSAAETLARHNIGHLRRVHDAPANEKIDALSEFLKTLDLSFARGQVMAPRHFNRLLRDAAAGPNTEAVHDAVLRAQSQAVYAPQDLGHFGLALRRYAHFTSPIRRYADIIVHRALITALALGPDGLDTATMAGLEELGAEISDAERRAMRAERDTADRLIAHFLSNRIGAEFDGRVTGLARSGLFVGLTETGADGFVPAASLGDEYFVADEASRAMIGERSGKGYRVGDAVTVRLREANPLRGQIAFEMLTPARPLRKAGKSAQTGPQRQRKGARPSSRSKSGRMKRGKTKKQS
ncbi:3'-to-5' exoribonuclease RNase R [hydrothermal vent metagenome]|uniref:exoribonuclease II n=1 Tax=hydrothermal vent metagenome TaxID=652676 RepID=A0A3B0U754_9ZZZZ